MLACTFLDAGKIWLYNVLGRCLYDAVSKQILRGQFPGGSGSGLEHHLARFGCKSRHGVFGRGSPPLPPTGAEWRTGGVLARNMMPGGHQEALAKSFELGYFIAAEKPADVG